MPIFDNVNHLLKHRHCNPLKRRLRRYQNFEEVFRSMSPVGGCLKGVYEICHNAFPASCSRMVSPSIIIMTSVKMLASVTARAEAQPRTLQTAPFRPWACRLRGTRLREPALKPAGWDLAAERTAREETSSETRRSVNDRRLARRTCVASAVTGVRPQTA